MTQWIDTHCHLDAAEFEADRDAVRAQARDAGVSMCIWPAVRVADFERVQRGARAHGDAYALGIHPLCAAEATEADLAALDQALTDARDDPNLVAVGEIGLDAWVPEARDRQAWDHQVRLYREQLKLARRHGLPVLLHVRKSADALLKGLRDIPVSGGVAHAFNGSWAQAQSFADRGFVLGFGGAITHERALNLRRLATRLPLGALVVETDAPDMPPSWLYVTAQDRQAGQAQGRNTPGELPRVAETVAQLRGLTPEALAEATTANAQRALPRLAALMAARA